MEQSNCAKFYIYFKRDTKGIDFNITRNPQLTMVYMSQSLKLNQTSCHLGIIGPALRIGEAYYLTNLLKDSLTKPSLFMKIRMLKGKNEFLTMVNMVKKQLNVHSSKEIFRNIEFKIKVINLIEISEDLINNMNNTSQRLLTDPVQGESLISQMVNLFKGRILFQEEIILSLQELGFNDLAVSVSFDFLEWLKLKGSIEILPSITYQSTGPLKKETIYCSRCGQSGSIHQIHCIECGETCYYCESCVAMGEATLCRPLYKWNLPKKPEGNSVLKLNKPRYQDNQDNQDKHNNHDKDINQDPLQGMELTKAQQQAYITLQKFMLSLEEKALLMAVCGAGKTEIVFGAIDWALRHGQRVLFAIPRKDVVLELLPRLKKAFPQFHPIALYGGSPDRYNNSQLVIATTHQTLRFAESFDLVVLDEVDAFPYKGSQMLKYAVERAKRKLGKIIYMTATPSRELLIESQKEKWIRLTIPARHHGYPVPEPRYIVEKTSTLVTSKVTAFILSTLSDRNRQLFIFVPSIELAEQVCRLVREKLLPLNVNPNLIQFSHSKDKRREAKRELFSQGRFPIFITTTIMERGVTVPKANVLVLFAHWENIYQQETLIQMAGRAGRSTSYPYGEVIFHGAQITKAMQEARKIIVDLNKEALKAGYLREKKI